MALLTHLSVLLLLLLLLLLACVSQQLAPGGGQKSRPGQSLDRGHHRPGRSLDRGHHRPGRSLDRGHHWPGRSLDRGHHQPGRSLDRGHHQPGRSLDRGHHRPGRSPKSIPAQTFQGKLVTRAREDCSWTASGGDVWVLGVSCRKGHSSFGCEYEARPAACPQYSSNVRLYWKQVARSLRKQKRLCRDGQALVRTGLCRKASRDAHFRLREERTSRPPAGRLQPSAPGSCRGDNKKLAEEHCSDSWSSLCTFLFTMMKDNDC